MSKKENKEVTDTMAERATLMRIGLLPILARPLTLLQIEEMAELARQMDEADGDYEGTTTSYTFSHGKDAGLLNRAIVVSLFRKRIWRALFGGYVMKRMDSWTMERCVKRIRETFDFGFFLTSIIFLKGMRRTEKEKTEATALGDSWVES